MEKEERIKLFHETVKCVSNGSYINAHGEEIQIPSEQDWIGINNSTYYDKSIADIINFESRTNWDTKIEVINIDCLYAAQNLIDEGFSPVVVNFASFLRPGGGVERGSAAQEENIFRRSNIYESLYRFSSNLAKEYGLPVEEKQYPLPYENSAIYSPNITVFRESEDKNYAFMDKPYFMDFITIAAIKHPTLVNGKLTDKDKDTVKGKIRMMLDLALYWENDAIILGAFGCGAYGNPPEDVAMCFHDVLNEPNYKNKLSRVVFAILDDKNSHKAHNPRGNYLPFKEIFN